jgi:hypothetical protein
MMGSIDFAADRQKKRIVARAIKHTIDRVAGTERQSKKKEAGEEKVKQKCSVTNRTVLAQDF